MTLFLAAAAALCITALALLLRPLLRRRIGRPEPRAAYDLRLYRDQLDEVERDRARGLLGAGEAEATRIEIKRRMLAAADAGGNKGSLAGIGRDPGSRTGAPEAPEEPTPAPRGRIGRRAWAAVIALLLPCAAGSLYLQLGVPGLPDRPLAERRAATAVAKDEGDGQGLSLEEAATQLAKRLETRPDDATGWFLLGRAYLSLDRPADAVPALARARKLAPDQPEVAGAYAEAAVAAADGRVDDTARDALATLLALQPDSAEARFLLALGLAQQGDLTGAVQGWTDLLALSPADAQWVPTVREHISRAAAEAGLDPASVHPSAAAKDLAAKIAAAQPPAAVGGQPFPGAAPAPGPGEADVAAAAEMSPEQRAEMIRGMVERLARRLREHPDDLEGWRRLARAYDVLGEPAKAEEARARVAALEQR